LNAAGFAALLYEVAT